MVTVHVFMIGLVYGEVHLQVHLFIGVLQVYRGDEVLPLEVGLGQVVHGFLRVPLPVPLVPDVTHPHQRHAEEHQHRHQAHPQAHRRPVQVSRCPGVVVGAGGAVQRHVVGPAPGAAVAGRAEAGRQAGGSAGSGGGDAGPAVEAALEGAAVGGLGAVAARVAWGAGAVVVVDAVGAGGAIGTGVGGTLVDVALAALAREAGPAAAHVQVPAQHAVSTCVHKTQC